MAEKGTKAKGARGDLELWGGVEASVNRVEDRFSDQNEKTGHAGRPGDLDAIAALGIRTLRYPVLWERTCPLAHDQYDWSWSDSRLGRLRALGIRPIVGLVHHGSGPRYTHLLDPDFPRLLAAYAGAVAARYPWADLYTPVNEPLTTARFSGLYGLWYPHGRDDGSFVRALIHQCAGVALAMEAIRRVNPGARLVQTEDLAKIHSTPLLGYQAEFENHRRWLTYDLLCGRVDRAHPLWHYLLDHGIKERELGFFLDRPCRPDIAGFNYYVTSERFLDHRLNLYPNACPGGNGRHTYVDVEAVRTCDPGPAGLRNLLREAWGRFRLPMAITEAQLACTREEQGRWLWEMWREARAARDEGMDVRAVTVWSLFGAVDWNSLLTADAGYYEPGAFDIRAPAPRPTALARLAADLARGREPGQAFLAGPGWWRRSCRLMPMGGHKPLGVVHVDRAPAPAPARARPLAIVGATGTLGRAFARACEARGLEYVLLSRRELDIADPGSVRQALRALGPWAVVNAAGYVRVDEAETDADRCRRENTLGPARLAEACARARIALLTFSSDLVFDGQAGRAYVESDPVRPLGVYGQSKAEAERAVLARLPEALVVRTSAFFGPWDEYNFVVRTVAALRRGEEVRVAEDQIVSPTYVPDLVHASLDLLEDGEGGIWHLANGGARSWAALAAEVARLSGLDPDLVRPAPASALGQVAPRPAFSALASARGWPMPPLEYALERCLSELGCTMGQAEAQVA